MDNIESPRYHGHSDLMAKSEALAADDPTQPQLATVEEQTQYDDLVSRGMMLLGDIKEREGAKPGGFGTEMLNALKSEKLPLEQTFGYSLGNMMMMLYQNAAFQGYEYEPSVVVGAMEELSMLYYIMAKEAGAIASGPPSLAEGGTEPQPEEIESELMEMQQQDPRFITLDPDEETAGQADAIDYDFSEEELQFIEEANMRAIEFAGQKMLKEGQIDQQQWKQFAAEQVKGEVRRGVVEVPEEEKNRAFLDRLNSR